MDDNKKHEIMYVPIKLGDIMQHYAKDFDTNVDGTQIIDYEYWIDTNKQEVVFKLFIGIKQEE